MDDQPNLREFLNEVSSFSADPAPRHRQGCGAGARRHRQSHGNRRIGLANPPRWRGFDRPSGPQGSFGRDVRAGRQPGQDARRQKLADRQCPHPARGRRRRAGRPRRLPRRRQPRFVGQAEQFPPRRHPLSDPGLDILPVYDRGHSRDLRRQRRAAHRDRHGLSDRRHPRHALRRPDAVASISPCSARPVPASRLRSP